MLHAILFFSGICVGYVLRKRTVIKRERERERKEPWCVVERRRRRGGKRERAGVGVGFEATKVAERIRSDKLRRVKENRQKKVKRINEITLSSH